MQALQQFLDRRDAGKKLAATLERDYRDQHALILGIPRGGVEVAYEVAVCLNGSLSVVITKKLPHPFQPELAIGAAAEDGSVFLSSLAQSFDSGTIRAIIDRQLGEIQQRINRYRKGRSLPDMKNRIVIIVDDGIATGSTIVPAIKLCKARKASKVIVAAPVSGRNFVSDINALADRVVVMVQPEGLFAVGEAYRNFDHPADREVVSLLENFARNNERILR